MTAGLSALRHPDIRRLEVGWALSLAGTFSYTVALLAYSYGEGGAHLVAAYGVASTVPGAVFTPMLMSLTDRVGGATMLRVTTGARTLLVALAAGLAWVGAPAAAVIALAAGAHSLSATFRPTQATSLPWLARTPAELTAATVTATMAENLAALVGPVLAGIVLAAYDAPTAIAVSAVCLLLATSSLLRLSVPEAAPGRRGPLGARGWSGTHWPVVLRWPGSDGQLGWWCSRSRRPSCAARSSCS